MRGHFQPLFAAAHQSRQLFVDDLDDHLRGGEAFHNVLAHGAFRNARGKVLCDLVVDVGFEKRQTHLAHGLLNVAFRQLAFAF